MVYMRRIEYHGQRRFFSSAFVRFLIAPVLLLLLPLVNVVVIRDAGTAHAGAKTRSCQELILFEGGNVNNYVKQFAGVTDSRLPLDKAGRMLALLVQLDGLYSQIGYGPLGYVYIKVRNPETCTNELVFKRLKGEECCSDGKLQEGRAALILSGNFQRVKDQIYLLTDVEFLRKDMSETARIHSGVPGQDSTVFVTRLPDTRISFTPRKFTNPQLDLVAHNYSDVMDTREVPDMNAKEHKIDPFDIDGFSYYIEEVRDDWLYIHSYDRKLPSGWVKVPRDIGGLGLRELLPELYYMDATAVYLQTRINMASFSSSRYRLHLEKFKSLMSEFAERVQGPGDRRALGLMKSMYATLLLERHNPEREKDMIKISTIATEAEDLLPTSSEAKSLAALTRYATKIRAEGFSRAASSLEKDLLRALSTDPSNIYIKANLERLWQLRTSHDKSNWKKSKITALRERFQSDPRIIQLIMKPPTKLSIQ